MNGIDLYAKKIWFYLKKKKKKYGSIDALFEKYGYRMVNCTKQTLSSVTFFNLDSEENYNSLHTEITLYMSLWYKKSNKSTFLQCCPYKQWQLMNEL